MFVGILEWVYDIEPNLGSLKDDNFNFFRFVKEPQA